MPVEIELKFIATLQGATALPSMLANHAAKHFPPQHLHNIYFETADNFLRHHDIGLRIRGTDDHYEMTIKTAGKAVGGLHQRPEYNVKIPSQKLALHLFPADIWPSGCDITTLENQLQPLFSTDFIREKWQVTIGHSEIEVCLDKGAICCGERSEALCEIELELLQGNSADLFTLANTLACQGGLRQSNISKAARGYQLAQNTAQCQRRPLPVLHIAAKSTVEQGIIAAFELALNHWQYHEELWLNGDQKAQEAIVESIALLRQNWIIFGNLVPRKASNSLRNELFALSAFLGKTADAQTVCYSAIYLKCKLALTSWVIEHSWKKFVDEKRQKKLAGSFKRFCDTMLSRSGAKLKAIFSQHQIDKDIQELLLTTLSQQILALHILSGVYPAAAYQPYIDNWRTLQLIMLAKHPMEYEAQRKQVLKQTPFWLTSSKIKHKGR